MNERGSHGYLPPENRAEALTPPGTRSYARSGEFTMPEGTGGSADNTSTILHRGNRPDMASGPLVHPITGQPLGNHEGVPRPQLEIPGQPQESQYVGIHNPDQPDDRIWKTQQERNNILNGWVDDFVRGNGRQPTAEEMRTLDFKTNYTVPPGYNPPPNAEQGIIRPQRLTNEELLAQGMTQEELAQRDESFRTLAEWSRAHPDRDALELQGLEDLANRGIDISGLLESGRSQGHFAREGGDEVEKFFEAQVKERERGGKVNNMNELLQEIMLYSDPQWGVGTEHALLKVADIRRDAEGRIIDIKTEINQQNFLYWIRERTVFFHNDAPDDELQLFQKVRLQRDYRDISIGDMLEDQARYFRDAEGNQYKEMADFVRLNLWQLNAYRSGDLAYKAVMGEEEALPKTILQQYYKSTFTKGGFYNQSALANVLTLSADFDSDSLTVQESRAGKSSKPREDLDTKLGGAINTAFLTYYYISDSEKLKELLGEDTALLNADAIRNAIRLEAAKHIGKDINDLTNDDAKSFIESTRSDFTNSAEKFFTDQEVSQEDIMKFINIYNIPTKQSQITKIVNGLINQELQKKYGLNKINADFAQLYASSMARLYGAGWRNDLAANANDAAVKPGKLREYREKQAQGRRGGALGNPYNIFMFKSSLVDYLAAARSEELMKDENGNPLLDHNEKRHHYSLLQLMEMMEKAGKEGGMTGEEKDEKVKELGKRLRPVDSSMRDYATNHMMRAFKIYDEILSSNEIDFNKFTETDALGNIRINRQAFEKEVKDGFLKTMRYCYSTFNQLDFSKTIRVQNQGGKWENQPMALSLFGRELLDVKEFWKRDYEKDANGKIVMVPGKDHHGHPTEEKVPKEIGIHEHEIDYSRVNENKEYLWKMVALGRLATDIYAHREHFSTDKRMSRMYYRHMIEALETIPGIVDGNEDAFRQTKKSGHFFDHEQIKWLRQKATITEGALMTEQVTKDVFGGIASGLKDALQGLFKGISRSS